jgi:hypothetical protein
MSRGRPFEPGNKCGRGRPKGSPNKKRPQAQEIFEQNSGAIMALAINRSREDPPMLRMLASRIVPRQRESPVKIGRLPMSTLSDLDRASEVTLQKAAAGKISPSEAHDICALIENHRRVLLGNRDAGSNEPSGPDLPKKDVQWSKSITELLMAKYRDIVVPDAE